jgi:hypothetical protein
MTSVNVVEIFSRDATLQNRLADLKQRLGPQTAGLYQDTVLIENEFDSELLSYVLATSLNGDQDLIEQNVNVDYVKREQKLALPAALNINLTSVDDIGPLNILKLRYWKAIGAGYAELKRLVTTCANYADIRAAIDARTDPVRASLDGVILQQNWCSIGEERIDDAYTSNMIMASISRALGFNCDIRNAGLLRVPAYRCPDDAWMTVKDANDARRRCCFSAYTNLQVAALNLEAVQGCELAAWARAYALSARLLPSVNSALNVEYYFTAKEASKEAMKKLDTYQIEIVTDFRTLCLNVIALFGLLHLAKDHTFKTHEDDMKRIAVAYIRSLRTLVMPQVVDYMEQHIEAIVRTAAHPFGLGQTYFLARYLNQRHLLANALSLRVNATPPPVQRLYIVQAATDEWRSVAVGSQINDLYHQELSVVKRMIEEIDKDAPHYSGLYRIYGLAEQLKPSAESMACANALMPLVYGYAMSQHQAADGKKDGLGLALSLSNVVRSCKAAAEMYKVMWETYMGNMESEGLMESVRAAYNENVRRRNVSNV